MRFQAKLLGCSAALLVSQVISSSAQAQTGVNSRYSLGYGFLSTGPYYNLYGGESIPYYSLYPPVYYSAPVPRSYGYSPFAYPPGIMTPDVECAPAAPTPNPHVPQKAASAVERTAIVPKLIYNPFVEQPRGAAVAALPDRSDD
jgi:hypothetical protein